MADRFARIQQHRMSWIRVDHYSRASGRYSRIDESLSFFLVWIERHNRQTAVRSLFSGGDIRDSQSSTTF